MLFIYKLAAPHHVKLTPLMGSYLSGLEDRHSPTKATCGLPGNGGCAFAAGTGYQGLVLKSV